MSHTLSSSNFNPDDGNVSTSSIEGTVNRESSDVVFS